MQDKSLEQKVKEKKAEYMRNYRQKNKEKISAINKRYWERKVLKESERSE